MSQAARALLDMVYGLGSEYNISSEEAPWSSDTQIMAFSSDLVIESKTFKVRCISCICNSSVNVSSALQSSEAKPFLIHCVNPLDN